MRLEIVMTMYQEQCKIRAPVSESLPARQLSAQVRRLLA